MIIPAGLHSFNGVEDFKTGDCNEIEKRHQENPHSCSIELFFFSEKSRKDEPEGSGEEEERAHDHVVARVLVCVG